MAEVVVVVEADVEAAAVEENSVSQESRVSLPSRRNKIMAIFSAGCFTERSCMIKKEVVIMGAQKGSTLKRPHGRQSGSGGLHLPHITLHGEELGYGYHAASARAEFTRRSSPDGSGNRELNLRGYKYNVIYVIVYFPGLTRLLDELAWLSSLTTGIRLVWQFASQCHQETHILV